VSRCIKSNQPQENVGFVRAHAARTRVGRKTQGDALPKKKNKKNALVKTESFETITLAGADNRISRRGSGEVRKQSPKQSQHRKPSFSAPRPTFGVLKNAYHVPNSSLSGQ
jgi:hypothetical protein